MPAKISSVSVAKEGSDARLRTDAAKRYKKVATAEALIRKILMIAQKKFCHLNSPELLQQVYNGQLCEDRIEVEEITRSLISFTHPLR